GDAVQNVGGRHRLLGVSDDDELRVLLKLAQDIGIAANVGFVEGGVDFIEDAERTGLAAEDGQEESDGGEGFFAAAHERDTAQLFAGWAGDDFDAAFEDVRLIFEDHIRHAAAEQLAEKLAKMFADGREGINEHAPAVEVDLG